MNFSDSIRYGFKNYANFSGVIGRSTYWYWYLFNFLVIFAVTIIREIILLVSQNSPLGLILSLPLGLVSWGLFLPSLALMIRRLRDTGKSPLYLLLWLAPIVLALAFAVIGAVIGSAASAGDSYTSTYVVVGSAAAGAGIGAIIGGLAAGIWLIVLLAQPTKTRAQGNKYALV